MIFKKEILISKIDLFFQNKQVEVSSKVVPRGALIMFRKYKTNLQNIQLVMLF